MTVHIFLSIFLSSVFASLSPMLYIFTLSLSFLPLSLSMQHTRNIGGIFISFLMCNDPIVAASSRTVVFLQFAPAHLIHTHTHTVLLYTRITWFCYFFRFSSIHNFVVWGAPFFMILFVNRHICNLLLYSYTIIIIYSPRTTTHYRC